MIRSGDILDMRDLYRQGVSVSGIAKRFSVNWKTAYKWVRKGGNPRYVRTKKRGSILDPYKNYIRSRMTQGCQNAVVLLEEIKQMGYSGGYTILKDFMYPLRQETTPRAVERFETQPGEQAQVDWFKFSSFVDAYAVKRPLYAFVMVMGYSRKMYVEFTQSMKMGIWLQCHVRAFECFGGIPRKILYDNLKTVVDDYNDDEKPIINRRFLDFADHYGFEIRNCKRYRPRTKGKVERPGSYLRNDFWVRKDTQFDGVEIANALVSHWVNHTANKRVHGTTHRIPDEMFEEERYELMPISCVAPFDVAVYEERKVSLDCFVTYQTNRYSVPSACVGKTVLLRVTPTELHILVDGKKVTRHPILNGRFKVLANSEHFEPLKTSRREQRLTGYPIPRPDVQVRDLAVYEEFAQGGGR